MPANGTVGIGIVTTYMHVSYRKPLLFTAPLQEQEYRENHLTTVRPGRAKKAGRSDRLPRFTYRILFKMY